MNRGLIIAGCSVAVMLAAVGIDHLLVGRLPAFQARPSASRIGLSSLPSPAPVSQPPAPITTAPVASVPQQPLSGYEQVAALREEVIRVCESGESCQTTVIFTEVETNELAAQQLASGLSAGLPVDVKSVSIDFRTGGLISARVKTAVYGFPATVSIESQISVENGRPAIDVTSVGVPIASLRESIAGFVENGVQSLLVQLAEGQLQSYGEIDVEYTEILTGEEDIAITLLLKPRG